MIFKTLPEWTMELYGRMPVRLQEAALSLYARKLERVYYGEGYEQWRQWLEGWRGWSPSYIENWRNERLLYIVRTAGDYVEYYRQRWSGLKWKSVASRETLHVLPLTEKQHIRQNERLFVNKTFDEDSLWAERTSGTTGTSLKIYWPVPMLPKWWAITEVMVRNVAGVSRRMPRAMMGGRPVVRGNAKKPPYWRYNRRWKQLYFSSYHVSRRTAPSYIDALGRYGSRWMTGYGSAIAELASCALSAGLSPQPLGSVIVSGDTFLPDMRSCTAKFFNCKCFDHYGQSEGVAMAMECGFGRMHVIPVAGIIEILRSDGSACKLGETGEIVATTLLNDAMPFIRYRTGDYAAWSDERNCPCGNKNPIIRDLEGRVDDYLVTGDGRKIGRLSTALKKSPAIHSAQLVQHRPGHAYLLVRPSEGYKSSDSEAVCDDILKRIGSFKLDVVEVPEIPKTPQGKTKLVVRLDEHPAASKTYERIFRI